MKRLIDQAVVWLWVRTLSTQQVTDHLMLVYGHRDPEEYVRALGEALDLVERTGKDPAVLLRDNLSTIILTHSLDKVAPTCGAFFFPAGSRFWRKPKSLAARLLWAAEVVRAKRAGELRWGTRDEVMTKAEEVRKEFWERASRVEG
jgi:hypothetical protein